MLLSKKFLAQALSDAVLNKQEVDELLTTVSGHEVTLSIDSRTIQPGELFLALKGPNFDGHNFVVQALEKGACGAIISELSCLAKLSSALRKKSLIIHVIDTFQALVMTAKAWRTTFTMPFVGITGSVGKTSTKEMLKTILQVAGVNAYVSYKNQNNIIGLCLNLLKVRHEHTVGVFELGISEKDEMAHLVDILRPTLALITCVAHAHGQGLGSLHEVAYEKRQIFKYFSPTDVGVVFGDQDLLVDAFYVHPVAKFGLKTKNQVQARKIHVQEDSKGNFSTHFILKWYGKKAEISMHGNHLGMVKNALGASTLAYLLKISFDAVTKGLQTYQGTESRFEMKHLKDNKGQLINDCYNANPESVKAALIAFNQLKSQGKKIAVLGDMLELGEKELYWHRQIGRVLRRMRSIACVILVGERAGQIAQTAPSNITVMHAKDWQEASKLLDTDLAQQSSSLVLVKGSSGVHLSNLVKVFVK